MFLKLMYLSLLIFLTDAFIRYAAIILVAIIYYYSPPMGTKTWMKALLYPSFLAVYSNFAFVLPIKMCQVPRSSSMKIIKLY